MEHLDTGHRPPRRRLGFVVAAVVVPLAAVGIALAAGSTHHSRLVWSDDFAGAAGRLPNPQVWTPVLGGNGWGNSELECYTDAPSNVALDGHGHLDLTAIHDPGHRCADGATNDYTSARLQTLGHKTFRYGTIEVRAKLPTGSGTWPAIWFLGSDYPQVNWPTSGEIDLAEIVGSDPTLLNGSVHGKAVDGSPYIVTRTHRLASLPSAGYHVYGIVWTANRIAFTVDGTTYFTVTPNQTRPGAWPFNQPFYMLLDLAVGGSFPGAPSAQATWPQTMSVDWVKVYRN